MVDAYAYCNITPDHYWHHTPAELDLMVRIGKIRAGIQEPQPSKQQSDEEMEAAVKTFVHPTLCAIQGVL